MSITVVCTSCGGTFNASDKLAGKSLSCPKCNAELVVPAAPPTAESRSVMSELLDEVDPATLPKGGLGPLHPLLCPNCRATMQAHEILCVACGYNRESGKTLKTKRDVAQRPPEPESAVVLGNRRAGTQPSFETETSLDALFDTTSEVLFNPSHTFANLVLHGNWALTCIYACVSYVLATLAGLLIWLTWLFIRVGGNVDWQGLADHAEGLLVLFLIYVGTVLVAQFFGMLLRTALMHLLVMATGPHRGGPVTTLKVNGYVDGAIVWLSIIPIVGVFLLVILYPTHMVLALARAHRIGIPRAIGIFVATMVLFVIAAYVLLLVLGGAFFALFQFSA